MNPVLASAELGLTGFDADVERALDLIGIFVFAVSGGLVAVRKGYDVVGMVVLAAVTGFGGGLIRDLMLGDTPPVAFRDKAYLALALLAAGAVFVGHELIDRRILRIGLVFDAAGLGLFCVTGTVKALTFGVGSMGAIVLGVITAVGGGVVRDVLAGEQPYMFRADSVLYSIPAALGATVVAIAWRGGWYVGGVGAGVAAAVFALRTVALRFGWHAPRPVTRQPAEP